MGRSEHNRASVSWTEAGILNGSHVISQVIIPTGGEYIERIIIAEGIIEKRNLKIDTTKNKTRTGLMFDKWNKNSVQVVISL